MYMHFFYSNTWNTIQAVLSAKRNFPTKSKQSHKPGYKTF